MISGFYWPDRLRNVSIESVLYLMSSAVLLFCDIWSCGNQGASHSYIQKEKIAENVIWKRTIWDICFPVAVSKAEDFQLKEDSPGYKPVPVMAQCICTSKTKSVIFSGGSPYPGVKSREIAGLLQTGYRMPKPPHISQDLWVVKSSFITPIKISISTNVTHNNYVFHISLSNHSENDKPWIEGILRKIWMSFLFQVFHHDQMLGRAT